MHCGVISVAGTEEFLQTADVTCLLHQRRVRENQQVLVPICHGCLKPGLCHDFWVEARKEESVKDNMLLFYFMHPGTLNQSLFSLWKFVDILASFLNPILSRFPPIFCWRLKNNNKTKSSGFFFFLILWGTWEFVLLYCLVQSKFWCSKGKVKYYWIFMV